MSTAKHTKIAFLSAVLGAASLALSAQAEEPKAAKEKCYGIAKAGENNCSAVGDVTVAPVEPRPPTTGKTSKTFQKARANK